MARYRERLPPRKMKPRDVTKAQLTSQMSSHGLTSGSQYSYFDQTDLFLPMSPSGRKSGHSCTESHSVAHRRPPRTLSHRAQYLLKLKTQRLNHQRARVNAAIVQETQNYHGWRGRRRDDGKFAPTILPYLRQQYNSIRSSQFQHAEKLARALTERKQAYRQNPSLLTQRRAADLRLIGKLLASTAKSNMGTAHWDESDGGRISEDGLDEFLWRVAERAGLREQGKHETKLKKMEKDRVERRDPREQSANLARISVEREKKASGEGGWKEGEKEEETEEETEEKEEPVDKNTKTSGKQRDDAKVVKNEMTVDGKKMAKEVMQELDKKMTDKSNDTTNGLTNGTANGTTNDITWKKSSSPATRERTRIRAMLPPTRPLSNSQATSASKLPNGISVNVNGKRKHSAEDESDSGDNDDAAGKVSSKKINSEQAASHEDTKPSSSAKHANASSATFIPMKSILARDGNPVPPHLTTYEAATGSRAKHPLSPTRLSTPMPPNGPYARSARAMIKDPLGFDDGVRELEPGERCGRTWQWASREVFNEARKKRGRKVDWLDEEGGGMMMSGAVSGWPEERLGPVNRDTGISTW